MSELREVKQKMVGFNGWFWLGVGLFGCSLIIVLLRTEDKLKSMPWSVVSIIALIVGAVLIAVSIDNHTIESNKEKIFASRQPILSHHIAKSLSDCD